MQTRISEATIARARDTEILGISRNNGHEPKKKGTQHWISCPAHEDKTPSLAINIERNVFYGHCCGASGDAIAFQQHLTGATFPDAVRALVGEVGYHHSPPDLKRMAKRQFTEAQRKKAERERKEAEALAECKRSSIIEENAWSPIEVLAASPVRPAKKVDQWKQMLHTLYSEGDPVIWIGEFYDSGKPCHANHFRRVSEWLALDKRPATRIAPAIFPVGCYRRSGDSVASVPYIVIEADQALGRKPVGASEREQNRRANYALIRWLRDKAGLTLRAIIDTGGKSAHGWFDHPGEKELVRLAMVAPGLGIDDLLSKPAQPVRLPNVLHEKHNGHGSSLIYLAA